jgi:hypothetical protein
MVTGPDGNIWQFYTIVLRSGGRRIGMDRVIVDANGNLTDSGVAPDDFVTGIKLEGAQSALNPDSNGVVTIPNAVATGQAGATNGLMTDAQALELSQIAAWTWSYAPFTDSGEGSESTAAFPFTVS